MRTHESLWKTFLRWLAWELAPLLPPPQPAFLHFSVQATGFGNMTKYKVTAHLPETPPQSPAPITGQVLHVSVNGDPQAPQNPPLGDTSFVFGTFSQGDTILATLAYTDANGDLGPAKAATLNVDGAQLPPEPGDFGFSVEAVDVPDENPTP